MMWFIWGFTELGQNGNPLRPSPKLRRKHKDKENRKSSNGSLFLWTLFYAPLIHDFGLAFLIRKTRVIGSPFLGTVFRFSEAILVASNLFPRLPLMQIFDKSPQFSRSTINRHNIERWTINQTVGVGERAARCWADYDAVAVGSRRQSRIV